MQENASRCLVFLLAKECLPRNASLVRQDSCIKHTKPRQKFLVHRVWYADLVFEVANNLGNFKIQNVRLLAKKEEFDNNALSTMDAATIRKIKEATVQHTALGLKEFDWNLFICYCLNDQKGEKSSSSRKKLENRSLWKGLCQHLLSELLRS